MAKRASSKKAATKKAATKPEPVEVEVEAPVDVRAQLRVVSKPDMLSKVTIISAQDVDGGGAELYRILETLIRDHHMHDLEFARIGLAWRRGWKPDVDGKLMLASTRKSSELDQRLTELDFVIMLNADAWPELDAHQRKALIDHELCHCAPKLNDRGEQERDETGRREWRIRKHDIEEFSEIAERYGPTYRRDVEEFVKAVQRSPLFTKGAQEA